jgi:phosphoglycolate phosphatase-like HAD superfamily hydrolase
MPRATTAFHNRIALVFDFDGTLGPDTLDAILETAGYEPERFHAERIRPRRESGWDALLATLHAIVEAGREDDRLCLSPDRCAELGRELRPFAGVPEMFDRVREWARAVVPDVEVHFHLLTCGLVQVHREMPIAQHFRAMWGSELAWEDGEPVAARQIVTHPDKQRYLLQMAKGLSSDGPNAPADVYRDVPDDEWFAPLDQVVYVGDGVSDMPAFALMHDHGGLALGVVDAERIDDWEGYDKTHALRRVENLAPADYSEGSELMKSLRLAVTSAANLIALRRLGRGE